MCMCIWITPCWCLQRSAPQTGSRVSNSRLSVYEEWLVQRNTSRPQWWSWTLRHKVRQLKQRFQDLLWYILFLLNSAFISKPAKCPFNKVSTGANLLLSPVAMTTNGSTALRLMSNQGDGGAQSDGANPKLWLQSWVSDHFGFCWKSKPYFQFKWF